MQALPSQATLLGIPPELRTKIFEYIFDLSEAGSRIKLNMFGYSLGPGVSARSCPDIEPGIRIPVDQAPPTKTAILVCRQLYLEFGDLHAAAFRKYWSQSIFDISRDALQLDSMVHATTNNNLQHVKHFIIHAKCISAIIPVALYFQAGKWIGSFRVSHFAWLLMGRPPNRPDPRASLRLIGLEKTMRMRSHAGAFSGERENMDPDHGLGFALEDIFEVQSVIAWLLSDNLKNGFQPL